MRATDRPTSIVDTQHAVRFYESNQSLAVIVAEFLQEGFAARNPGIVVAIPAHRAAILSELTDRSFDVVKLQRSGDLLLLDAADTLSSFMTDGKPDEKRFTARMCEAIDRVSHDRDSPTVRIYGQMVDVLWQNGEHDAAIRLEVLWNELALTKSYSLLCGYAIGNFYKDARFDEVCRQHNRVDVDKHSDGVAVPPMPGWSNA